RRPTTSPRGMRCRPGRRPGMILGKGGAGADEPSFRLRLDDEDDDEDENEGERRRRGWIGLQPKQLQPKQPRPRLLGRGRGSAQRAWPVAFSRAGFTDLVARGARALSAGVIVRNAIVMKTLSVVAVVLLFTAP